MNAKELLNRYSKLPILIEFHCAQVETMEKLLAKVGKSGRLEAARDEVKGLCGEYADQSMRIAGMIEHLSPDCMMVVSMKYLERKSINEISRKLGYSERNTWRIHDKAIEGLQNVMDCQVTGCGEPK